MNSQPRNGNRALCARMIPQQPTSIVLFKIMFDVPTVLMHDQVFLKARDRPVKLKLLPAIVAFGRRRKHFHDQQRIENHILLIAEGFDLAADHAQSA